VHAPVRKARPSGGAPHVIRDHLGRESAAFSVADYSRPFQVSDFVALQKRVDSGDLQLVITDITVREVHARIRNAVHEELQLHARFREKARAVRSSSSPAVASTLTELDADAPLRAAARLERSNTAKPLGRGVSVRADLSPPGFDHGLLVFHLRMTYIRDRTRRNAYSN
jgi:hypothetical protein